MGEDSLEIAACEAWVWYRGNERMESYRIVCFLFLRCPLPHANLARPVEFNILAQVQYLPRGETSLQCLRPSSRYHQHGLALEQL